MRILMVLTYYYPHWTGLTAFAQRIGEGLVGQGHQVTVATSWYRRDLARFENHQGVRIVRIPSLLRLSRGQVMPAFPAVLDRLVREHDVVQAHTPMLETWLVAGIAHRRGRKLLMTHHGDLVMPQGAWNQAVQRGVGFMLDRGAASADAISMYTTDYAQHSEFLRPHLEKLVYIFPPVIFPRPDRSAARAWRQRLGLDSNMLIGFAGRFVEEKGFDNLLRAIPRVKARFPHARFIFAGEHRVAYEGFYGRCGPLLEAHHDDVIMLGLITDPQRMANYYSMCDVFALPSRTDCLASVQVEAMLCGTPVVATDIPGARQAVLRSKMGLLVNKADPESLGDGLIEVLTHRDAYVRSHDEIHAIFDPEQSIREYERLFQSLVDDRPYCSDEAH